MNKQGKVRAVSPIVTKVLDRFYTSLSNDDSIDDRVAFDLNELLRKGGIPNSISIDQALRSRDTDKP